VQKAQAVSQEQIRDSNIEILQRVEQRRMKVAIMQANVESRIQALFNKARQIEEQPQKRPRQISGGVCLFM
jgi:apolipoprotein N-acyltransferase